MNNTIQIAELNGFVLTLDTASPNEIKALRAHARDQMNDFAVSPGRRIIWKYQHAMLKRLCKIWHITGGAT